MLLWVSSLCRHAHSQPRTKELQPADRTYGPRNVASPNVLARQPLTADVYHPTCGEFR